MSSSAGRPGERDVQPTVVVALKGTESARRWSKALSGAGFRVLDGVGLEEAVELAGVWRPELILIGEEDGRRAAEGCRSVRGLGCDGVVVVAGAVEREAEVLEAGGDLVIGREVGPEAQLGAVKALLRLRGRLVGKPIRRLEAERDLLRSMLENAPVAMSVVSVPEFVYLAVNPAFQALAPGKQMLGRSFREVWAEVDAPLPERLERVAATGEAYMEVDSPYLVQREAEGPAEELFITFNWIPLYSGDGRVDRILTLARETTAEVRLRQELRASESRYRTLSEGAQEAVLIREGLRIVEANRRAEEMFGYSREELIRLHPMELFAERERAEVLKRAQAGDSSVRESVGLRKDGTEFPLEMMSRPLEYGGRSVRIGVVRDLTERKKAERALRESEVLRKQALDSSPDAVFAIDREYRLLFSNRRLQEMLAASGGRPMAVGESALPKEYPPEVLAQWRSAYDQVLGGEAVRFESGYAEAGQARHTEIELVPLRDADGSIIGVLATSHDVTEQRRAMATLRRSEGQLRALLATLPDLVWLKDPQGVYLACNPRFESFFGATEAEIAGKTDYDFVEAERAAEFRANDAAAIEAGGPRVNEEEVTFASDGHRELLETIKTPMYDAAGALIGVLGISRNITERKEAEEELRWSEERFRMFVEQASDGMFVHDEEGWFRAVNRQACLALGYSQEELLKMSILDIEQDYRQEEVRAAMEGMKPGDTLTVKGRHRRKDGSVYPAEVRFGCVEFRGEMMFLSLVRDVTERERANEALRRSEEQHRAILQGAMDGMWVIDMQGRVLEVNESACRMSGYSEEELLSMRIGDVEAEENAAATAEHIGRIVEFGGDRFETVHMRKDGSQYPVEASVQYRPEGGGYMVAFLKDLTERRRAEEEQEKLQGQLAQAQKMESVGRLAGGVAHDFNNLLTVINGYAGMVLNEMQAKDPLRTPLEEIQKAGQRAAALTRQLLAFSRKQLLIPRTVHLNGVLEDMRNMLERLAGEGIETELRLSEEGPVVFADPSQLDQVILNLVVNARDAMPRGGRLLVETSVVEVGEGGVEGNPEARAGRYAQLAVSDTGIGMDEATKAHIFEPFFTTKALGEGTGLGLPMVLGIVGQSGGYVSVQSEKGVGSTFRIYLPMVEAREAEEAPVAGAGQRVGHGMILVVEDQEEVRNFVTATLKAHGFGVIASAPGEAMRVFEKEVSRIDLVLTDVVMPGVNGLELSERMERLGSGVRTLLMSGYPEEVLARHGTGHAKMELIRKPFSSEELVSRIQAVLRGGPAIRIVVCEGEMALRWLLRGLLQRDGYEVALAGDAEELRARMREERADLLIVDAAEGLGKLRELRKEWPGVGIVAIAEMPEEGWQAAAVEAGADVVVRIPFTPEQILGAVAQVARRRR